MPVRKTPLAYGEIYHLVNRGVEGRPTFSDKIDYRRGIESLIFYRFTHLLTKLSLFRLLKKEERNKILKRLNRENKKLVEILCYCFMPNHIHLLVRQLANEGISTFMRKFTDSYTRYFNSRHQRNGHLFQGPFKSVHIQTEEQLIHVSRYIHINPVVGHVIEDKSLETYPWSSLAEYLKTTSSGICNTQPIFNHFSSPEAYRKFLLDQIDYAKKLKSIEHLILE